MVKNKVVDPLFEKRPLTPCTGKNFTRTLESTRASNTYTEKGSRFQAFSMPVKCDEDVMSGLAAVRKIHPMASHHVYAYRYADPITGDEIIGHSDDGEWSAGKCVATKIAGTQNILTVVVCYFGGSHLGKRRWDIYRQAAKSAVSR